MAAGIVEDLLIWGKLVWAYPEVAICGSVANVALGFGARALLASRARARSLRWRIGAYALAPLLGGPLGVLEAHVTVDALHWEGEAAGLALGFVPIVLGPSIVGTLAWLLGDLVSGRSKRGAVALAGALIGATCAAPLGFLKFDWSNPVLALITRLPRDLVQWVEYPYFYLPVAAGAAVGYGIARRVTGQ